MKSLPRTSTMAMAMLMGFPHPAPAAPAGGSVVRGTADIKQAGSVTSINQSTRKAVINWQGFSIGRGETVNFIQPSSTSATLNRVIGNEASVISGALNANGRVFLVNSAGVLFNKSAQVNVGGLVAATLNITNDDFMAGNYVFSGSSTASVVNRGRIHADPGGYVALLGKTVSNEGFISAKLGTVAMSSGNRISLNFEGDSLIDVTLEEGALNALVENKRAIRADGGRVIMTVLAADEVLSAQVNNSGIVQARTVAALTGEIRLYAHGGTANVDGTLDASAPSGGNGGFIETSGTIVNVKDSANVTTLAAGGKTGIWLVDPNDFTVAASGGNMTGAAVANALANNNYIIETGTMGTPGGNGDIHIDDAITWSSNNTLTLTAERDININNAITANGASAKLAMNYGRDYNIRTEASYAGAVPDANGKPAAKQDTSGAVYGSVTFSDSANANGLAINGDDYTLIHGLTGLAAITNVAGRYALARDLDADGTPYSAAVVAILAGTFTGLGHTVSNLTITAGTTPRVGLFGDAVAGSTIRDIGLVNANVTGQGAVGALLGRGANATVIRNAYATGNVTAAAINAATGAVAAGLGSNAGGLVGQLQGGSVTDSYANVTVAGFGSAGGLIGSVTNGTVSRTHATGGVTAAGGNVGGLVGGATATAVSDSYATGLVSGVGNSRGGLIGLLGNGSSLSRAFASGGVNAPGSSQHVGGLVGLSNGAIDNVWAAGSVTGSINVGGLVGWATGNSLTGVGGSITNAHATGVTVTGAQSVGGFAGQIGAGTAISNASAEGSVNGSSAGIGGFAGSNYGDLANVSANTTVSGQPTGDLVGGLVGINGGTASVRDSSASGSVTGDDSVGGLIGENQGAVTGSHTTASVTGNAKVGGLVGHNRVDYDVNVNPIINQVSGNSASGQVTGNTDVGGLFGRFTGGDASGNAWNTDSTGQSNAAGFTGDLANNGLGSLSGSMGLSDQQFQDVKFYLDGTIGQVLAGRASAQAAAAAEEAARSVAEAIEAAAHSANVIAANATVPQSVLPTAARTGGAPSVANNITIQERAPGEGFGATIRSIEIDGQRFDLDEGPARGGEQ